jgi:hypothetical protein
MNFFPPSPTISPRNDDLFSNYNDAKPLFDATLAQCIFFPNALDTCMPLQHSSQCDLRFDPTTDTSSVSGMTAVTSSGFFTPPLLVSATPDPPFQFENLNFTKYSDYMKLMAKRQKVLPSPITHPQQKAATRKYRERKEMTLQRSLGLLAQSKAECQELKKRILQLEKELSSRP